MNDNQYIELRELSLSTYAAVLTLRDMFVTDDMF
jgi:hypothetical protein